MIRHGNIDKMFFRFVVFRFTAATMQMSFIYRKRDYIIFITKRVRLLNRTLKYTSRETQSYSGTRQKGYNTPVGRPLSEFRHWDRMHLGAPKTAQRVDIGCG